MLPVPVALRRLLLADHDTASLLQEIAQITQEQVPGASEVSITVLHDEAATVASTSARASSLDEGQYAQRHGPCLDACRTGGTVVVDTAEDARYPEFVVLAREAGVRTVASVPVPVPGDARAALNLYADAPALLDGPALETAAGLAAYAGVTIANMRVYEEAVRTVEQMHEAMDSRAVIEQAKGVLVALRGCPPEEAFVLLRAMSSHSNRKLRDVARDVVDGAAGAGGAAARQD